MEDVSYSGLLFRSTQHRFDTEFGTVRSTNDDEVGMDCRWFGNRVGEMGGGEDTAISLVKSIRMASFTSFFDLDLNFCEKIFVSPFCSFSSLL